MYFGLGLDWGEWASTVLSGDAGESTGELNVELAGSGKPEYGDFGIEEFAGWGVCSVGRLGVSAWCVVDVFSSLHILVKMLFLCFRDSVPCPALSSVSGDA